MTRAAPGPTRRGRRLVLGLAVLFALLLALAAVASRLVARGLERALAGILGTPVRIASADVAWLGRAVVLHDVELISPFSPDSTPLARIRTLRAVLGDPLAAWRDGTLEVVEASVDGGEVAIESRDEGSSLALLQHATAERSAGGSPIARWIRRLSVENLSLRSIAVRVTSPAGERSADGALAVERGDVRRLLIPLGAGARSRSSTIALQGATLRLGGDRPGLALSAATLQAEVDVEGLPQGLALSARSIAAETVVLETVIDGPRALRLDLVQRTWRAAVRGLDLSSIASAGLLHGRVVGLTSTQRNESGGEVFRLTNASLELMDLLYPEPAQPRAAMVLRGHPLDDAASLDLRAHGALLEAEGEGPVAMTARFADLPLVSFPELHLASGRTTGQAEMTLADGVVTGTATFRLSDIRAAAGAPVAMRAAYASYDTLAGSDPPEVTVPLSFRLSEPNLGNLFQEVAAALARELGNTAAQTAERQVDDLGRATRGAVGEIGRSARETAESAGAGVKRSLEQLVR